MWARRGTRPRAPRDRRYTWAYLFGAVCPERAVGAALVLPYADTEATGLHLAEVGRAVAPGAHAVVVLDRAGWHGAGDLAVPGNLTLLPLPSHAPELVWGSRGQEESDGYIRFSSGRDGACGQGRSRGAGPKAPSTACPPLLPSWRRPMRQTRRRGHGCSSLAVAPSRRSIVAHHGNRW